MKAPFLFPYSLKKVGWFLLILGFLTGLYWLLIDSEAEWSKLPVLYLYADDFLHPPAWFAIRSNPILDEVASLLLIIGGIMVAFSREKTEDEYIAKIRLDSLVWAVYVNYAILVLTILFLYSMTFFYVLLFNMFTPLVIFIIRFRWLIWHNTKNSDI